MAYFLPVSPEFEEVEGSPVLLSQESKCDPHLWRGRLWGTPTLQSVTWVVGEL